MQKRRQLSLETILNVSAKLAEEKGMENITLNQVAEKLGVKSPSLYNHVRGIEGLSGALAEMAIQRLDATVRDAAVGKSKAQALESIAFAYRKFARENPELYKAILRLPDCDNKGLNESAHAVVRIVYHVMEPYHYHEEDMIHIIRGFRSALHGFVSLENAGFFKVPVDADESYRRLVEGLIASLNVQKVTSC